MASPPPGATRSDLRRRLPLASASIPVVQVRSPPMRPRPHPNSHKPTGVRVGFVPTGGDVAFRVGISLQGQGRLVHPNPVTDGTAARYFLRPTSCLLVPNATRSAARPQLSAPVIAIRCRQTETTGADTTERRHPKHPTEFQWCVPPLDVAPDPVGTTGISFSDQNRLFSKSR